MKKKSHQILWILLLFLIVIPILSFGQSSSHDLLIKPPTSVDDPNLYLNNPIMGDSNSNGTRKDSLRVYVLQRGGSYFVTAMMRNPKWTMRIKAQDSTGPKPIIYMYPTGTTLTPPGTFISVQGDVYLTNLVMSGYFEAPNSPIDTNYAGKQQGQLFNTGSAGYSIYIDSCIMLNVSGQPLRTDNAPKVVKITNSIFGNMGWLGTSNLGAGKGIDVRAGSVDSLIVLNSTFVNYQDRVIRHYSTTAPIKYMRFDHNTLVDGMSYHGMLSLGKVGTRIIITNNLLYDAFALGNDTDATRQVEFSEGGEKDAYGSWRMTWVIATANDTTQYVIKNNYYAISSDGQNFFTTNNLTEGSPLNWHVNKKLGADSTKAFTKISSISLAKIPKLMLNMMNWYRSPSGGNKTKSNTGWNINYDYDRKLSIFYRDTLNCSYSTTNTAYTGATGAYPAGDLNWFPTKLAAWLKDPVSEVPRQTEVTPVTYSLEQNYPNPFNPSTNITYSLTNASSVSLTIYNSLGQEVTKLLNNEKQNLGKYNITWNGKDSFGKILPTGVYFYQLMTDGVATTKKMLLLK
jgi:hypothetical protein